MLFYPSEGQKAFSSQKLIKTLQVSGSNLLSGEKGSRVKVPHELVAVRKESFSTMSLSRGMRRRKRVKKAEVRRPARNDIVEPRVTGLTQGHISFYRIAVCLCDLLRSFFVS